MKKILTFVLIGIIISFAGCKKETPIAPKEDNRQIDLSIDEVTCTEAWLNIKTKNIIPPFDLLINFDTLQYSVSLNSSETTIHFDSLLAGKAYNVIVSTIQNPDGLAAAKKNIQLRTLDTTSHEFTWEVFEFGKRENSDLNDVAIINENDIWVVGEIYIVDSTGTDVPMYNAIHWDGTNWEYKRIKFYVSCSNRILTTRYISGIFRFDDDDLVICAGRQLVFITDSSESNPICYPSEYKINRVWGLSKNDFYTAADFGILYHYYNGNWIKIETETTVPLLDIWGTPDKTLYVTSYSESQGNTTFLRVQNDICQKMYEGFTNTGYFIAVWTNSNRHIYISQSNYMAKQINLYPYETKRISEMFSDVSFTMRGTDSNNIIVAGQHAFFGHYNGVAFKEIPELKQYSTYITKADIRDKTTVLVGYKLKSLGFATGVIYILKQKP